ncbi:MAG: hypothetical protein FWF15_11830 [Oscillospiraceae bacterium]|nr:hypothetical protein [Oscillospiraceae bacterium]
MTKELLEIIKCFESVEVAINSADNSLRSDEVLEYLDKSLSDLSFDVERSKKNSDKIRVPVLFGQNNNIDKEFNADALSVDGRIVIEIEAGRATENNQFLKDIFQACMMFEVEYLVLAVREIYRGHYDFDIVYTFLETLYISGRITLPLKGILLIGY